MDRAGRYSLAIAMAFLVGWQAETVHARGFRVNLMPHGTENGCASCHFNPGGGGARNPFGEDVNGLVSRGGREPFWTPDFAAEDSDRDGWTNGAELGDFDGDGVPERTVNISHPGIANIVPAAADGDCNLDTVLDADDLACVTAISDRNAVLSALNTLPGDLDGNGDVGFADFLTLSGNFGLDLPAYTDGNIDLVDGVGFADFLDLSRNFGKTPDAAVGANLSAVPEPSGGMLALMGLLPVLWLRHRRSY